MHFEQVIRTSSEYINKSNKQNLINTKINKEVGIHVKHLIKSGRSSKLTVQERKRNACTLLEENWPGTHDRSHRQR